MISIDNFKELSFLVYGVGLSGRSVINFFKKNCITKYKVWDDQEKQLIKNKSPQNLNKFLHEVDYIILSPGVSLEKSKNRNKLIKYKKKIITDIDLIFLLRKFYKSIVVTGTNGKSTTCKIINHVLKRNGYKTLLGGNIGTPVLDLNIKKDIFLIIEVSSFQLAHSQFINPDYAILLNISNDHLDWHGNMKNYINSKFKIFNLQKKNQYSFINEKLKKNFKRRHLSGKLVVPNIKEYQRFKSKIKNAYIISDINDENMSNVYELSKLININNTSLIKSLKTFIGLSHRYEIFFKKKNCTFINDSKATSFKATQLALKNTKNIYWIVGGLPKKKDKLAVKSLKKNIIKTYIIGKHVNFFKKQLKDQVNFTITKNLRNSIVQILKDIKHYNKKYNTILFSPSSASFDQYLNFEKRGEDFKKLSKLYGRKYI